MNLFDGLVTAAKAAVGHASPIHGAGKIIDFAVGKEPTWTGADTYKADQDIQDTLDFDGDGDIDFEDASEALESALEGVGSLIEGLLDL